MLHNNKIIDSDAFFEVNAITRQIANKTPSKIILMQNDHNSERFSFSLPRFIEGHDLLEVDKAEVHFLNGESAGIYEMNDLAVDPKDESKVVCSWLLSNNATKKADSLIFLLKFTCFADDGITVDYVWHTALFQGISVSAGLDNSGTVAENYVDILEQWRKEFIQKEEKNVAGGVAGLDENGKISSEHIPAGSGGSITVDDALSKTSKNPVQNKVVTANLFGKEDSANRSSVINANSTEEQYPSAKAVYELTNKMLRTVKSDGEHLTFNSAFATNPIKVPVISGEYMKQYVDDAIGDIETALENIIAKYGLGGDSE